MRRNIHLVHVSGLAKTTSEVRSSTCFRWRSGTFICPSWIQPLWCRLPESASDGRDKMDLEGPPLLESKDNMLPWWLHHVSLSRSWLHRCAEDVRGIPIVKWLELDRHRVKVPDLDPDAGGSCLGPSISDPLSYELKFLWAWPVIPTAFCTSPARKSTSISISKN